MTKEFIPYTEALALKELGFDEDCLAAYVDNELDIGGIWKDSVTSKVIHKAPLWQQAFKWFRDNDEDFIIPPAGDWNGKTISYYFEIIVDDYKKPNIESESYHTYEEAELACLKKLIEIKNE